MSDPDPQPELLRRALESGRLHSAYLVSGPAGPARAAALAFARGAVCSEHGSEPCEDCRECRRSFSSPGDEIPLDGTGRQGPLLRHIGDHPDLLWVERGANDTRVRIGQVRAVQRALRLRGEGDGRRVAVIADAEWLNVESQNALLRLLEEPPPGTTLVLVALTSAGLLATLRSRCQRVALGSAGAENDDPETRALADRLEGLARSPLPELLDWAEEYRGPRAEAASGVHQLLDAGGSWLRERVRRAVAAGEPAVRRELDAWSALSRCRQSLDQRNANPQMVAERALLALRGAGPAQPREP